MYALRQIIPSNNVRHSTPLHLLALVESYYAKLDTSSNFNNVLNSFLLQSKKSYLLFCFRHKLFLAQNAPKQFVPNTKIIPTQIVPDINCSQHMNRLVQYHCHREYLFHLYNFID